MSAVLSRHRQSLQRHTGHQDPTHPTAPASRHPRRLWFPLYIRRYVRRHAPPVCTIPRCSRVCRIAAHIHHPAAALRIAGDRPIHLPAWTVRRHTAVQRVGRLSGIARSWRMAPGIHAFWRNRPPLGRCASALSARYAACCVSSGACVAAISEGRLAGDVLKAVCHLDDAGFWI